MKRSNYKFFVPDNHHMVYGDNLDALDLDLLNPSGTDKNLSAVPYIINVQNATGSDVDGVKVLGANSNLLGTNLPGAPNNYGNPLGIQITMGSGDITYPEFLSQTQTQPFTVGLTLLYSTAARQVQQIYAIQYKDGAGNLDKKYSVPMASPYQSFNNLIPIEQKYTMDGDGMIIISKILAGRTLKLYLYPTNDVIVRRALVGLDPEQKYANPNIVYQRSLRLTEQATQFLLNN